MALGLSGLGKMTLSFSISSLAIGGGSGGTAPPVDTTAPTITSPMAFSVAENSPLVINLTASEAVSWAKTGGSDAGAFALDAAAATLTLGAKDFDAPSDSDGNNTFGVQIRAADAAGNASTQAITVTITNLLDTARTPLTAGSVNMAYNAANGTKVIDLPPLVEGEARAVSVSWLTADSATGDVFRNAMTGPSQSSSEQQFPVDVTTTQGGVNPVVTRFTVVVPAASASKLRSGVDGAVFWENSYGAQSANMDYLPRTLMAAKCKPIMRMGTRQARGGDTMDPNAHDRRAPVTAQKPPVVVIMNAENDFGSVTDSVAGGQTLKARLDQLRSDLTAIYTPAKIIPRLSADTKGARGKPAAEAEYRSSVTNDPAYKAFDDRPFFNPYDASQSSDQVHPNTIVSARALSVAIGASLLEEFDATDIFASGELLPNAINAAPFDVSVAWAQTVNSSGLTCVQSTGVFRETPSVPCRIFTFSGTSTLDPSLNATTMDFQLRRAIALMAIDTYGISPGTILQWELSSASGGTPIGCAAISFTNGSGTTFGKQALAAEGLLWEGKEAGYLPILPETLTGQTASLNFDMRVRGKQNVAADFEIRIARLNMVENDRAEATGVPSYIAGQTFTAGRPIMKVAASTSPASGSTIAVGGTIGFGTAGAVMGGRVARVLEIERDGVVVGTASHITRTTAAVPYMAVAADSGKTLSVYQKGTNSFGSDRILVGTITVS